VNAPLARAEKKDGTLLKITKAISTPRNARERFLRACRRESVDRPPIWMMRQAGRSLPEYRKLKEKHTFLELAQTPELAAEVTLQPIRRFQFDAAIIFSDILVVPEAMGLPYRFRETGGVEMEFPIRSEADIRKLSDSAIEEKLHYVADAVRLVKRGLKGQTALLGFAGSPWTLANYMLDGGSAREHTRALALFRENRPLFELLCEKLTSAVINFLRLQIRAGADAVQIFDSLGGILPEDQFRDASAVWMREIVAALAQEVPVIVFSKSSRDWRSLASIGADVVSVDYGTTLTEARRRLGGGFALQGNLDPTFVVNDTPEVIRGKVNALLEEMREEKGYIFNLGHGLLPSSRLENVQAIVEAVRAANSLARGRNAGNQENTTQLATAGN
jgi:uroporphyrinogen decarboxylase